MIVTMQEIDALRARAFTARENFLKGTTPTNAEFEDLTEQVRKLLRDYHRQRSTENLLWLLKHATVPCPGWYTVVHATADYEEKCSLCDAIEALVKEAK